MIVPELAWGGRVPTYGTHACCGHRGTHVGMSIYEVQEPSYSSLDVFQKVVESLLDVLQAASVDISKGLFLSGQGVART